MEGIKDDESNPPLKHIKRDGIRSNDEASRAQDPEKIDLDDDDVSTIEVDAHDGLNEKAQEFRWNETHGDFMWCDKRSRNDEHSDIPVDEIQNEDRAASEPQSKEPTRCATKNANKKSNQINSNLTQPTAELLPSKKKTGRREDIWNEKYERLVRFKQWTGHTRVPDNYSKDPELGRWISNQRRRKGRLSQRRRDSLNKISFEWSIGNGPHGRPELADKWNGMCDRLIRYKEKHGHTRVPAKHKEDPKLGNWVKKQRALHKNAKLSRERTDRLNEIGFVWEPQSKERTRCATKNANEKSMLTNTTLNQPTAELLLPKKKPGRLEDSWSEKYERLVNLKQSTGHTRVPTHCSKGPELGHWTSNKRYAKEGLSQRRRDSLNKICCDWGIRSAPDVPVDAGKWNGMYDRLIRYKEKHGHTRVPAKYKEDPKLGNWVKKQRALYKNTKLSQERTDRLNEIGFVWRIYSSWFV